MILRVSEAIVRAGAEREFLARLHELVADFPDRHPGLVRHEVLVDEADPRRIQYVSAWRDEADLISYVGARWRTEPVTFPGEERYLEAPLGLRHFRVDAAE
ncbi:putative quinol monooxygenase [Microbacterium binotii]|uniref:putative quinol monooxygenase n=1 Tax=Microbacterium binotii TaxID=462710 RepID=UPI001F459540|nr:antibiotic biosynthesis monooxygenase [Microbacterium binotii]UIN30350.1 antibiotic biosynthesis monooxygenase [Microbacterium binotii]